PLEALLGRPAGRLGLPDGTDPPGAVAGADPGVRVDPDFVAADLQDAAPRAHLREPAGVEDGPGAAAHHVVLLLHRREGALPGEVEGEVVRVVLTHQTDLLQGLDDLEAVRPDGGLQPLVAPVRHGVGEAHGVLVVALAHGRVGVDDAEVRVDPHAGD